MLNNEIFCNEYRNAQGEWQTSRFQDDIDESIPSDADMRYGDRRPYVIVPVPAESSWITQQLTQEAEASVGALPGSRNNAPAKRSRDDPMGPEDDVSISLMVTETTNGVTDADPDAMIDSAASDQGPAAARLRPDAPAAPAAGGSGSASHTEPADFPSGACMVYLYNADDNVKLNDVIEVIGVLSRTPELAAVHLEHAAAAAAAAADGHGHLEESILDEEMLAAHPPTSQVPRIHAILLKKESSPYPENLLSSTQEESAPGTATSTAGISREIVAHGRSRALGFLSMVLGGDNLAAEFLLLQLVASVQRRERESVVGVTSLNITGCPDSQASPSTGGLSPLGSAVAAAVAAMAPRCLPLALTLENLNGSSWIPRRAGDAVRMVSGLLQLPVATQIIADETVMKDGQLNESGLRNLAALQGVMLQQKIAYDFDVFTLEQHTDAPVTVLSSARTMLKGVREVVVPLKSTAPIAPDAGAVAAAVADADVAPARAYLAAARGISREFSIPAETAAVVEKDLADAKARDSALTADDFHQLLNLARLLAVSYGEKELTVERWGQALALEKQRQERL